MKLNRIIYITADKLKYNPNNHIIIRNSELEIVTEDDVKKKLFIHDGCKSTIINIAASDSLMFWNLMLPNYYVYFKSNFINVSDH